MSLPGFAPAESAAGSAPGALLLGMLLAGWPRQSGHCLLAIAAGQGQPPSRPRRRARQKDLRRP
eukprot:2146588-Rhodomonas_salina.1